MKRVYIHAYLQENLGDDLFVETLCRRYPMVRFYIIADKSYKTRFRDLHNCKVRDPKEKKVLLANKILKHFKNVNSYLQVLIRRSEAVIHIGGSSFVQHHDDWSEFYNFDKMLVENSKNLFLIGANFGPYKDQRYLKAYHELFKKYKGICLRDEYSWNLFRDVPQVSYAPDVLFGLKSNITSTVNNKEKIVIFSLIDLQNRQGNYDISVYEADYIRFQVDLVRYFISEQYKIILISFCRNEGDEVMIQKIRENFNELERQRIQNMSYQTDTEPILHEFEKAEIVIGTRFHSIVLGFVYECKVLPIIYNQKTEKMLDDLKYTLSIKLPELNNTDATELGRKVTLRKPLDISEQVKLSKRQFYYTDMQFASADEND
ncbi:polysaccharide pyruvyl transferase family protein [Blautia liquoris]|jgi:colanic acid/amylovoran biosynthesis protein|uniref:Polysaccharide pyruvyl transferase family protein n=1 Tax=Blautia liquoris TaxID=2779518 RepID=A0A7M2RID2_9FIRM|nr:polysaccharide pyruvyl transferase family protein [Blautia liquoris]QOV20093.1 polysaccharide pyruvyl transferase family protein [Blautia liquoris]